MEARLILEDGTEFEGLAAGAPISRAGEVVFSTGMVGYEQSLTDPSYEGQILTFTYPLIGNWGVGPRQFWESPNIHAAGVVISDLTTAPSHWQSQKSLDMWLREKNIPAIVGVDTRALTQKLREKGVMLGKIVVSDQDIDFWDPNAENLVKRVSTKEVIIHSPGTTKHPTIALLDCGVKQNIIASLVSRGATVYQLPWNFDPFDNRIRSESKSASFRDQKETNDRTRFWQGQIPSIDGLVITNGPGDPKMCRATINIIRKAMERKIPTFGICLGHQLMTLAADGDTYKLKFGHRSQNQPAIEERSKKCYITTQNHGYAAGIIPQGFKPWFTNANDHTNEGIIHQTLPFFSVQFHPEATPGPTDTQWLFDYFMEHLR